MSSSSSREPGSASERAQPSDACASSTAPFTSICSRALARATTEVETGRAVVTVARVDLHVVSVVIRWYAGSLMTQWSPPRVRPSLDPTRTTRISRALRERVLIYDGATGTNFQLQDLHADDFGGAALEGCNEILVVTKPDAVESLHRSFFDVGADVIETDSFGAFSVVLDRVRHRRSVATNWRWCRPRSRAASPTSTPAPARRASSPAPWVRAPSSRRSARSPTTTSRPVTRRWRSDSSKAASTSCSSRRSTTCSRARPRSRPVTARWSDTVASCRSRPR